MDGKETNKRNENKKHVNEIKAKKYKSKNNRNNYIGVSRKKNACGR